jgi:hypothetical protein
MPSAQVHLANAKKAVLAQQKLYKEIGSSIAGLRTDVDNTAAVVAAQSALNTIRDGKIIQISDNQAGLDDRVSRLEALNHETDWFGSAAITAVVGVISAVCFYILLFSARWDPLLAVEGGNDGVISSAARSIMNYHVAAYTFIAMAFTFTACVCLLGKRKPASRPTTTAPAPAEQPTQLVRVVEVVEAKPLSAPVAPSRPESLDWKAAQAL